MDDLPFRVVVQAGRTWTIREADVGSYPWARADRCLICEDGSVVRRFWVYPEDWRTVDGDALARFCQNARPIVAAEDRTRLAEDQPRLSDAR